MEDLALDGATQRLYAVSSVTSRLSILNTGSLRLVAVLSHLKDASGIALDPARHRAYITESKANAVAVVNTTHNRVTGTFHLDGSPQAIAVDTGLHRVFVGLFQQGRMIAVSAPSDKFIRSIGIGARPVHPFRIDSAAHRLYAVSSGSSSLAIVDTRTPRVLRFVHTGRHREGLDISPGTQRAYVSNEGDPGTDRNSGHTASDIDLHTGQIVDTLPTLVGPDGIAYDPNNACVYIAQEGPGRVSVIRLPPRDR